MFFWIGIILIILLKMRSDHIHVAPEVRIQAHCADYVGA